MGIAETLLVAVSLCADCFAVSLCSSVTLRSIRWKSVLGVACMFALIHCTLLISGWAFGSILAGLLEKLAHIVGFCLLLYVGGGMVIDGVRGREDVRDLSSLSGIVLSSIATSIDALAVGISQSLSGLGWKEFCLLPTSVFVLTLGSVVAGILGGKTIGRHFGNAAEIAGGIVLLIIGITILAS